MATETLQQAPKAFAGWDSSIYLHWLNAMSDMMLSKGGPAQMASETLSGYGGLMHQLGLAVEELAAQERAERSAAQ